MGCEILWQLFLYIFENILKFNNSPLVPPCHMRLVPFWSMGGWKSIYAKKNRKKREKKVFGTPTMHIVCLPRHIVTCQGQNVWRCEADCCSCCLSSLQLHLIPSTSPHYFCILYLTDGPGAWNSRENLTVELTLQSALTDCSTKIFH